MNHADSPLDALVLVALILSACQPVMLQNSVMPSTGAQSPAQGSTGAEVIDWPISTPEEQGVDSEKVLAALDFIQDEQIPIHSLLVIRDGKIVAISAEPLEGAEVVDVTGKVVAPGFIDLHAHGQTTGDMELQARDGVTTALEMEVGVYTVASWYAGMEGQAQLNYGATVSHVTARFAVFHGVEIGHWPVNRARAASLGANPDGANKIGSQAQINSRAALLRKGIAEGALGVGFGIYPTANQRDRLSPLQHRPRHPPT